MTKSPSDLKHQRLGYSQLLLLFLPMLFIGPFVFTGAVALILLYWDMPPSISLDVSVSLVLILFMSGAALAGLIVGSVQSLALRHTVLWAAKWTRATVVGWAIAG